MEEEKFLKSCIAEEGLRLIQDKVRDDVILFSPSSFPHLFSPFSSSEQRGKWEVKVEELGLRGDKEEEV